MYVAAKEQAAQYAQQGVNEPPIVSSNPTNFSNCEKQIRAAIPTLRTATNATLKSDCKQVYTQYSGEVMNFLIQSYWLQAAAHKAGISDATVASDFAKLVKKQFPTKAKLDTYLAENLKATGQTYADLKFTHRVQSLYGKLVKKQEKKVSSAAIAAYYHAHASQFGTAETRNLNLIRTKTAGQAQAAFNALKSGQSWKVVAKKYGADPSAKVNGGALTNISAGQEEGAASKAIFSAALNKLVGPVKGIFGYYVLEVTKITPKTQESLAKATPAIKTQLTSTGAQAASQKVLKAVEKAWKGKTTCRTPNYQGTYCSNYKAPKTTTTPTPTPTTTTSNTISVGSTSATTKSTTTTKKK
jgi:hypothetical protein